MRTTLKYLSAACAGALLLACAGPGGSGAAPPSADASYAAGRQFQLAGRRGEARAAYEAALAREPDHANARNGLATLYAEQGELPRAIAIWQALTAKAPAGPGAAYLFGNLGYAWLLSGDYDKAQAALEQACLLDPLNHRSWQHLGDTLYRQGRTERARQMYRQAIALREHDFRADYAVAGAPSAVGAIDSAARSAPQADPQWASTDIRVRADGMLELHRTPAAAQAQPVAGAAASQAAAGGAISQGAAGSAASQAATGSAASLAAGSVTAQAAQPAAARGYAQAAAPGTAVALLEIRNGNGVTGMARTFAARLGDPALKVMRLTNEKSFNVRRTRVEYQGGFRASAERLAGRFGNAGVVEVKNCKGTDLRLVIGRDLVRTRFVLRPLERPERALAVAAEAGKAG